MENKLHHTIHNDTICALSTPFGTGAISVIRLSGIEAVKISKKIFNPNNKSVDIASFSDNSIFIGKIINDDNSVLDEVVVSIFRNPHSYTGEDIVEISCHGSVFIQEQLLQLLIKKGARAAKPGEFTMRAFLNGKIDLSQAEAVSALIASNSIASHRIAMQQMKGGISKQIKFLRDKLVEFASLIELELDFSEEDLEFANRNKLSELLSTIDSEIKLLLDSYSVGNALKNGIPVAIIGKPNVGKSTLLNIFLNEDRAIVSEMPGTTRDTIEDIVTVNGICFRFIDTAGLRNANDIIENMGIERTYDKIKLASVIIYLFDISETSLEELHTAINDLKNVIADENKKIIIVANKLDKLIESPKHFKEYIEMDTVFISAKRRQNINLVTEKLLQAVEDNVLNPSEILITNSRHYEALHRSGESLKNVINGLDSGISNDMLAEDIRITLYHLGEITGDISNDEILDNIFSKFCVGK